MVCLLCLLDQTVQSAPANTMRTPSSCDWNLSDETPFQLHVLWSVGAQWPRSFSWNPFYWIFNREKMKYSRIATVNAPRSKQTSLLEWRTTLSIVRQKLWLVDCDWLQHTQSFSQNSILPKAISFLRFETKVLFSRIYSRLFCQIIHPAYKRIRSTQKRMQYDYEIWWTLF